ncbi:MAG: response regulator transcription factor [Anaerolineales bacterium]
MSAAILIVDDDEKIREPLEQDLVKEGYRVHNAAAGQEALEVLKEKEIALIILELKLPDMNGVEVMRQVVLSYPQTPVVILTEERSFESAVAAVRGGAVDYLLKPYKREDLLSSVGQALADKAERDQKKMLYSQVEFSLEKLKEVDGIEVPDVPPRRVIAVAEGVMVDLDRREMWRGEERVELTPSEGLVLSTFLENRGRVLTHQELIVEVKGKGVEEGRAPEILRPMISRLRT